jgi:hypothetical protein
MKVITKGEKVPASAAALLSKLNVKPFAYGIEITKVLCCDFYLLVYRLAATCHAPMKFLHVYACLVERCSAPKAQYSFHDHRSKTLYVEQPLENPSKS